MASIKKIFWFCGWCAIVGSVFFLQSCQKDREKIVIDYKYEYFPLDSGMYWIYEVDSIHFYDITNSSDTSKFYLLEKVESFYDDITGRPTARLERYKRYDTLSSWQVDRIWFANLTKTVAEKTEENQRIIKLLFPPRLNQTWKGNQHLNFTDNIEWMKDWDFTITEIDMPKTVRGITYDSTITILQHDNENLIKKVFATETYAKRTGLIYKETRNLGKNNVFNDWDKPESGFIHIMQLVEFGRY